ncbi:MAG: hypothetical protein IPK58_09025 [Acidobacteria bacterium]|nr:hypothetical protein [Acidobacteriota bacterium]
MKNGHITELIDEKGLANIDSAGRELIEVHAAECAACADALAAARFSVSMLRARADIGPIHPSPFFETRVLSALRERQLQKAPFWSFRRWWQASHEMVGAMVLMAAVFGLLTIFAPADESQADLLNPNIYSTEADVLNQRPLRDMSREQVLEVIYSDRKEQGKSK